MRLHIKHTLTSKSNSNLETGFCLTQISSVAKKIISLPIHFLARRVFASKIILNRQAKNFSPGRNEPIEAKAEDRILLKEGKRTKSSLDLEIATLYVWKAPQLIFDRQGKNWHH